MCMYVPELQPGFGSFVLVAARRVGKDFDSCTVPVKLDDFQKLQTWMVNVG